MNVVLKDHEVCTPVTYGVGYTSFGYNGYNNGCNNNEQDSFRAGLHIMDSVTQNGMRTDNCNGFRHVSDGQRELMKDNHDSESSITSSISAVNNTIVNAEKGLSQNIHGTSRDVLQTGHYLSKDIGDNKFYTSELGSTIRQEICSTASATQKEIYENRIELIRGFGDTKLDACKNTGEIARQAAENYANIQLQASQNTASLSQMIKDCCCETQKAIQSQAASIRESDLKNAAASKELALTIENNRLRDKCELIERNSHGSNLEVTVVNAVNSVFRNLGFVNNLRTAA